MRGVTSNRKATLGDGAIVWRPCPAHPGPCEGLNEERHAVWGIVWAAFLWRLADEGQSVRDASSEITRCVGMRADTGAPAEGNVLTSKLRAQIAWPLSFPLHGTWGLLLAYGRAKERTISQLPHLLLWHGKIASSSIANIKTGRAAVPLPAWPSTALWELIPFQSEHFLRFIYFPSLNRAN